MIYIETKDLIQGTKSRKYLHKSDFPNKFCRDTQAQKLWLIMPIMFHYNVVVLNSDTLYEIIRISRTR